MRLVSPPGGHVEPTFPSSVDTASPRHRKSCNLPDVPFATGPQIWLALGFSPAWTTHTLPRLSSSYLIPLPGLEPSPPPHPQFSIKLL